MMNGLYRKTALFMLRQSNTIAVIMMIIAIVVCFSTNTWLYLICLLTSSIYLGVITAQYISAEDESAQSCDLQSGCHAATFNSRLSILSNVTIVFFGIAFSLLTAYYLIKTPEYGSDVKYFDISNGAFIIGWFKLMFIYIISITPPLCSSSFPKNPTYGVIVSLSNLTSNESINSNNSSTETVYSVLFFDIHITPSYYKLIHTRYSGYRRR